MNDSDRRFVEAVAGLAYCNPFLPEWVELERLALGEEFVAHGPVWQVDPGLLANPNLERIRARLEEIVERLRAVHRKAGVETTPAERKTYRDAVLYLLYDRYEAPLWRILQGRGRAARRRAPFFPEFERDVGRLLLEPRLALPEPLAPELLFSWFFQVRRAFHFIHRTIVGGSMAAARLRAAVWQSVFTHDMRRYRRSLYQRMGDVTTLITGPSGTGKELVARAIGLARFIPFDRETQEFAEDFEGAFFALNLSALSPTLVESELFGHRRGAFTGALEDRAGWFEECPVLGAVFLDEIGELEESIQVKLLRVLETRTFQRIGETRDRRFHGKLIAATNREPYAAMREGRMREDFYYRLCSDLIRTPSLRKQLEESPEELENLVLSVATRLVGSDEARSVTADVVEWIDRELGPDYPWPGNFRELEQCVRNVLIRGRYQPARRDGSAREEVLERFRSGSLTAEELLSSYTTLVYAREGSYQATGRRLGLDRRTVKAKLDPELLDRL